MLWMCKFIDKMDQIHNEIYIIVYYRLSITDQKVINDPDKDYLENYQKIWFKYIISPTSAE